MRHERHGTQDTKTTKDERHKIRDTRFAWKQSLSGVVVVQKPTFLPMRAVVLALHEEHTWRGCDVDPVRIQGKTDTQDITKCIAQTCNYRLLHPWGVRSYGKSPNTQSRLHMPQAWLPWGSIPRFTFMAREFTQTMQHTTTTHNTTFTWHSYLYLYIGGWFQIQKWEDIHTDKCSYFV